MQLPKRRDSVLFGGRDTERWKDTKNSVNRRDIHGHHTYLESTYILLVLLRGW